MLPLWLDDSLCRELSPDPGPREAPVRSQAVLLFIESEIGIPPLKEGHNDPGQTQEKLEFRPQIPALQNMGDIAPDMNCLDRIVMERQVPLELCQPVGQIWRTQHDSVLPQMRLIPGQRIVVQRIAAENFLCRVRVEQMVHQEHSIHVLLVKDGKIMDLLLIREEAVNGAEDIGLPAHLRYDEEL